MPTPATARHRRNFIKTLERGLRALEAFTPQSPALSLTELARRLGVHPATALRFAYTLEQLGYLRREPETGAYRLAGRVLDLGRAVHPEADLRIVARPVMEALGRAAEETVSLAVREGLEIVVLAQVESPRPVSVRVRLGERQPAHCTAQGKVLLAALPDAELRAVLQSARLAAYGPRTLTTAAGLLADLRRVRQRGYALNNDEMDAGLRAIAVPVTAGARVMAALSVDVPVGRLTLADLQSRFQPLLANAAAEIAAALGG